MKFTMWGMLLVFTVILLAGCGENRENSTKCVRGYIDLSKHDFDTQGMAVLNGEWEFYWKKLLTPEDFEAGKEGEMTDYYKVPSHWEKKKYKSGEVVTGEGYGTFRVKVKLRPDNKIRAVKIGSMGLSYRIWVNGEEIGANGRITTNDHEKVIVKKYENYGVFTNNTENYEIVMQVSNYSRTTGGLWGDIFIGSVEEIQQTIMSKNISESIFIGFFLIITLYNLIYYIVPDSVIFFHG
jgi:hypothetical protein